jgi:hypothetical protein
MRAHDRNDNDDPRWKKSITDIEAPTRVTPITARADPKRKQRLSEKDAPMLAKPTTDSEEPSRENVRKDIEDAI